MKNTARKFLLFFLVVVVLTSLFSVAASALSVDDITGKVTEHTNKLKLQFDVINDLVMGFLSNWQNIVDLVVAALLLLVCFFGYKLLGPMLFLAGAYLGVAGGLYLFEMLGVWGVNVPEGSESIVKWVIAAVVGIILSLLLCALKKVGMIIFLACFSFIKLGEYTNDNLIVRTAITAAIVVLCIFFFKYFFIAAAAYWAGTKSMHYLFGSFLLKNIQLGDYLSGTPKDPVFYVGLLVAFLGMFVQYKSLKKNRY